MLEWTEERGACSAHLQLLLSRGRTAFFVSFASPFQYFYSTYGAYHYQRQSIQFQTRVKTKVRVSTLCIRAFYGPDYGRGRTPSRSTEKVERMRRCVEVRQPTQSLTSHNRGLATRLSQAAPISVLCAATRRSRREPSAETCRLAPLTSALQTEQRVVSAVAARPHRRPSIRVPVQRAGARARIIPDRNAGTVIMRQ